jgi:high affinity Mn2+ porin
MSQKQCRQNIPRNINTTFMGLALIMAVTMAGHLHAQESADTTTTPAPAVTASGTGSADAKSVPAIETPAKAQNWNLHMQNTDIVQGDPGFSAQYSGPNSLPNGGETRETVTLDLMVGARLWPGAEAHADVLTWQGFGLGSTFGVEAFPNGDAYKAGTATPDVMFARLFIRQTIGFGGEQEEVKDDELHLAGKQDIDRLTLTIGRFSPLDVFDNNTYASDPHTQFMNWATMGNSTWDYGQDTVGFATGFTAELNQPVWTLRYGVFQMPRDKNGFTGDDQYLMYPQSGAYGPFFKDWAMSVEFERRYSVKDHPGVIRFLAWLNEADMASYSVATAMLLANPPPPNVGAGSGVTIPPQARAYRYKYGFGLNWEQEVARDVGIFSRLGWNDGHDETWTFTDTNWSASLGVSVKGEAWRRPDDTFGFVGVVSGASSDNQKFLEAGGTDMLDGDGALNYSQEKVVETYYDFDVWKGVHFALDYQFVADPAFNRDRGPVSVFGARLHWEF